MKSTAKLNKYLKLIKDTFNVEQIISEKQDTTEIKDYYLTNHLCYLIFYNRTGFMHMGISRDGVFKKEDLLEPLNIIDSYIKKLKARKVLELGAGNGSNSAYLAKKNTGVSFIGLDLSKKLLRQHKNISNYRQDLGNYHDLSNYTDNSFEVAFIIEALCHSNNKKLVLDQMYRKLKNDGVLIIIDGDAGKPFDRMSPDEKLIQQLTAKSMAVDKFDTINEFRKNIKGSKLKLIKEENLTEFVLPTMRQFEKLAKAFYKFSPLTKLLRIILPETLLRNSIAGILMLTLLERGIGCYYLHVLKKVQGTTRII